MMRPRRPAGKLRIALLAHSTNPRGGVVHAMEVAEALTALGHEAVLHAPDVTGEGFFRRTRCRTVSVAAAPVTGGLRELVEQRAAEYVAHFESAGTSGFDVWHAQDGISGNALATLAERGRIRSFVRTVHHLDRFADPRLQAMQGRAVGPATRVCCVSQLWRDQLRRDFGVDAPIVGNGVNLARYSPVPAAVDDVARERWGLGAGPVFLAVGGVEARKNTVKLVEAFVGLVQRVPAAQLVISGGVSLLDHGTYRQRFDAVIANTGLAVGTGGQVILTGGVADEEMPALYRLADALAFPSVTEGFGLVVLEAMASGTPAIVSRMAPFTEHLGDDECAWVDPLDPASILSGLEAAIEPANARRLARAGLSAALRFPWSECARRHIDLYDDLILMTEPAHA